MTCEEVWRDISDYVDDELDPKQRTALEEHYRLAFILRDVNELSITETANILGITRGAVKTRLRRARLMLRDILSPGLQQGGEVGLAFKEVRKPWE